MNDVLWAMLAILAALAGATGWLLGTVHGLRKQVSTHERIIGQLMVIADKRK